MSMDLRRLLGLVQHAGGPVFPDNAPLQAQPGRGPQHTANSMRMQYQQTPGTEDTMGQLVQNAGSGMQQGLAAPDATSGYMGGGGITLPPHQQLRSLLNVSGGAPQGFPGDFAAAGYPQPNMQQASTPQMQGVQNPGMIPMQGSRGVKNPQSKRGRSGNITF